MMKTLSELATFTLVIAALGLACGKASAQPSGNDDPAQFQQQMQQRMAAFIREQLVITNDDEWNIIEPRLTGVMKLKMETMFGSISGFRGMGGNRGGDTPGRGRRNFAALAQSSPEADALQKAIDSNAPAQELKAALANLRDARKRKQAELTAAQEQLREVLTFRQEAILVSMSILD
jgi:hypothetical protein